MLAAAPDVGQHPAGPAAPCGLAGDALLLRFQAEAGVAVYRTQFGVLRKVREANRYDANGRIVPADVLKTVARQGESADLGRSVPPFVPLDREVDMTLAHVEFTRRLIARTS